MGITDAAARAAEQVLAVRDSTSARLALAGDFYRAGLGRYGCAVAGDVAGAQDEVRSDALHVSDDAVPVRLRMRRVSRQVGVA